MQRRKFIATTTLGVLALGSVGAATLVTDDTQPAPADNPTPQVQTTATGSVTKGDLASEREFKASVSFGDSWTLGIDRTGTVTKSVAAGTIVKHGEELVRIDEKPVFLAKGEMPMYRTLEKVNTRERDENNKRKTLLEGQDVTQLQQFLLDAGFDADGKLEVDGVFGTSTEKAVKAWQEANGLPVTGKVDSGQIVFTTDSVRISKSIRNGSSFDSIEVTRGKALILVDTNNRDRSAISPGTTVSVVLPDGSTVEGEATKQVQATDAEGSTVWRTTIDSSATLPSETGTATIKVTDVVAKDAVLVPASSLIALAEGGFAVEKVTADGTQLVRVDVDEVLDGKAAVTGDISPGDSVVVPT